VRFGRLALLVLVGAAAATPARAELAFFADGQTMSVKGHRVDGDSVVLSLRSGGAIICDASLIVRFEPDEVPYPDETAQPAAEVTVEAWPYYDIIDSVAAAHDVSPKLVRAVIQVESNFQETALSPKGAMGLMQLMPETARRFDVADPYNPRQNIEGGIKYLRTLLDRFPNVGLALAAYNAGEGAVERFRGIPPYAETQNYVRQILRLLGQ